MKRFTPETTRIFEQIIRSWDDYQHMGFMAAVQRLRVFYLKDLPTDAQRALRRGAPLGGLYHMWSRLGLEPTRVQAAERIARDVVNTIHDDFRPYIEDVAFSFSGCSIMRDHFPFFLIYFPDTVRHLSEVLTELLADTKRSALWESARALLRKQHDAEYAVARGWDTQLEEHYNAALEQLIQSIPNPNSLWFCFDSYGYLRVALDDALAFDVLGETLPYVVKMLRCAPDNLIWLKPNLDPVNFYHPKTTQTHRDQVDLYVKAVLGYVTVKVVQGHSMRGRRQGPDGFPSLDAFVDYLVTVAREVQKTDPDIPQEKVAAYLIDNTPHLRRLSAKQPDSHVADIANKARWIRKHLPSAGLTWDDIQKRARSS